MSNALINMMRQQAAITNNSRALTDLGIVLGYNPQSYLVQVQIYPEDSSSNTPALNTGWIPFLTPVYGLYAPPTPGQIVEVHYQAGSLQNAYACNVAYNFNSPPSQTVQSGEFCYFHSRGSYLQFKNNGNVLINGYVEIDLTAPTITITCPTSVTINAPMVNLGSGTTSAILNAAAATIFNNHFHTTPSGNSGPPTTTMGSGDMTTNVFAS
ncbi:MAG: hypothetical protein KGJ07_00065 [Patescibacteria group bacterium]|nr:hypothetical protein [Patescibacteria group bacterium]